MSLVNKIRFDHLHKLLDNYYLNCHDNREVLDFEDYKLIKKIEIKLYNNVVKYLKEYEGDFKELYTELMNTFCDSFLNNNCELAIQVKNKTINLDFITNNFTIKPEFDPRFLCREYMKKIIKLDSRFDNHDNLNDIINNIEKSCYLTLIQTCKSDQTISQLRWNNPVFLQRYEDRVSVILNHLNPNSITNKKYGLSVLDNLYSGNITPTDIGKLTDTELCPSSITKETFEINTRNMQKIKEKYSTLYSCPVCKTKKCTYRSVQLKSLDEEAQIICRCLNCNNVFNGH